MGVLARLLRSAAIVISLLVVAGWAWFAIDEGKAASNRTQEEIAGRLAARDVDPAPEAERAREKVNSKPHELIDDANDVLLRPFATIAQDSGSKWVRRTVPAALALLIYGFGLALL